MKHYAVYNAAGVIRFSGHCPNDSPLPDHADEGLQTLLLAEPLTPGEWHVAGGALQPGRLDLRTLADRKAERWEAIKAARAAAIDAPLPVAGIGTFDCDEASRANIANAALLMQTMAATLQPGEVPTIDFTLADNTVATLTAGQMVEVALHMGAKVQAAHATGRALREAIDAATTAAAVEAVAWPA